MSFVTGAGKTNIDLLYCNLKRIPDVGEEIYTDCFSLQLGGGLPATMINLARLGVPVKLATYLGNDLFSGFAEKAYKENNTEILNLYCGDGIPVNISSAMVLKDDRSFVSYGKELQVTDNEAERFYSLASGAAFCYIENAAYYEVYKKLKEEGTTLIYDIGWDDDLCFEKYGKMIELSDYFVPNRKEAMKLTGASSPEDAAKRLEGYFEKVIVKADADGCICSENGKIYSVPSIKEFKNIDSTGAGDAFLSGFIYGLYKGYSFREAVLMGNITGGKAVTEIGALSAYLTEGELLSMFSKYK